MWKSFHTAAPCFYWDCRTASFCVTIWTVTSQTLPWATEYCPFLCYQIDTHIPTSHRKPDLLYGTPKRKICRDPMLRDSHVKRRNRLGPDVNWWRCIWEQRFKSELVASKCTNVPNVNVLSVKVAFGFDQVTPRQKLTFLSTLRHLICFLIISATFWFIISGWI